MMIGTILVVLLGCLASVVFAKSCCSSDLKTCGGEKAEWCHLSAENCQGSCDGFYIDDATTESCTARWHGCTNTDECCNPAICRQLDGYSGCDLAMEPTPVGIDPPVAPAPAVLPPGPYIPAYYSERITLPKISEPNLNGTKTNCPHLDSSLLDWHSPGTWLGGAIPGAGQNVSLPPNSAILIQKSVEEKLGVITVPSSSKLVFGESNQGISLDCEGLDVQGSLVIGSASCRLDSEVTITLHGDRPEDAVTNPREETYKGISVTGSIHIHGKRYFRTWTRLSKTISPGESVLLLQHAVNWEPGQEIVVVTTAMKDSREWHQNEQHIIKSVDLSSPNEVGAIVYLEKGVMHRHIANSGYQAEVGLLSRSIVVQGSASDSEPTDLDPKNCSAPRSRYGNQDAPCPYKEITGFGGHVIIHGNGRGYIEGTEFRRMGQTNVLGRYPVHFHLLGDCPECYVRDSAFHRSFYRCISIHGTNHMTVSENVAYDVTGYCYYLEDGVEEYNSLSFNLVAYVHSIGPDPPGGYTQTTDYYQQSSILTLPADVTASGFYITNVHNNLIGNAASGGWAGFAFPTLPTALQSFRALNFRPSSVTSLTIDGNTAHSSGWWWDHAGAFYFGGALYYNSDGVLEYTPGRSFDFENHSRRPCMVDACEIGGCVYGCPDGQEAFIRVTNSKAFLNSGTGFNSWSGTFEIVGYESHDNGLCLESLSSGFWIDDMLAVCRTGEQLVLPPGASPTLMKGNGFFWYDTGQEHIISNSLFRNCGYRSEEFAQYDNSPDRGCGNNSEYGCHHMSTTFGFLTHSDEFTPELMQGTSSITFASCGRRFYLYNHDAPETVSGRGQNWIDADGSASGLNAPTFIVSGAIGAASWWNVDDDVVLEPQGPLRFIRQDNGPERGLAHFRMSWDESEHDQVGTTVCGNGDGLPCVPLGHIRHAGPMFSKTEGLPVTAIGDVIGPVGGFGWVLNIDKGAPRDIRFEAIEVLPGTPLLLSVAYPPGTTFNISVHAAPWCSPEPGQITCMEQFHTAVSIEAVRTGPGNQYYVDDSGVVTFRIVQTPKSFVGRPEWFIPSKTDSDSSGSSFAVERFERAGVYLPRATYGPYMTLHANCGGSGPYCSGSAVAYDPIVCPLGFQQEAFDQCCSIYDESVCVFARDIDHAVQSQTPQPVPPPRVTHSPSPFSAQVNDPKSAAGSSPACFLKTNAVQSLGISCLICMGILIYSQG